MCIALESCSLSCISLSIHALFLVYCCAHIDSLFKFMYFYLSFGTHFFLLFLLFSFYCLHFLLNYFLYSVSVLAIISGFLHFHLHVIMKSFATFAIFAILAASVTAKSDTESHTTITIFKYTTITASRVFNTVSSRSAVTAMKDIIYSTVYVDQFGNLIHTSPIPLDTALVAPVNTAVKATLAGFDSTLPLTNNTLASTNATLASVNASLVSKFVPSIAISANQTGKPVPIQEISIAAHAVPSSADSDTSGTLKDDTAAALQTLNNLISVSWKYITPTLEGPYSFSTLYNSADFEPASSNVAPVNTIINKAPVSSQLYSSFAAVPTISTFHPTSISAVVSDPQSSSFSVISSAALPLSPVPPPPSSGSAPDDFAAMCLEEHNKFRAIHNAPPVTWNNSLANYAVTWMNQVDCELYHSPAPFGENLSHNWPNPKESIGHWYNEKALYAYNNPVFSHGTSHFTQLVWKSTTAIGCATRNCPKGDFLVCEYYPAGNADGEFTRNVTPY